MHVPWGISTFPGLSKLDYCLLSKVMWLWDQTCQALQVCSKWFKLILSEINYRTSRATYEWYLLPKLCSLKQLQKPMCLCCQIWLLQYIQSNERRKYHSMQHKTGLGEWLSFRRFTSNLSCSGPVWTTFTCTIPHGANHENRYRKTKTNLRIRWAAFYTVSNALP